jgi:hypothetical protein
MGWPSFYLCLGLIAASLVSASAADAERKCYCRTATGQRLEVGTVTCLKTNYGLQEARCGMVLNNTAWIFTGNKCPIASLGDKHHAIAFAPDTQTRDKLTSAAGQCRPG